MERFRRLLYLERRPNGSGRGFACAVEVARAHRADLTVAALATECAGDDAVFLAPGGAERLQALRRRCRARLEDLAGLAAAQGVSTSVRILERALPDAVLDEVERGGYDLVMKVADGARRRAWWRLDTPDGRLLRRSPCPVWLLDPAQRGPFRLVLAAVDVGDDRPDGLNSQILATAAAVADRSRAKLHVLHAWTLLGEPVLADPVVGVSRGRLDGLLASTRLERRQKVERLLARALGDRPATVELRKGSAVRAIPRSVRRTEADVVVLGSSGRTGLQRLLFGNVAERLLGRVPSSLLVVPQGFAHEEASDRDVSSRRPA